MMAVIHSSKDCGSRILSCQFADPIVRDFTGIVLHHVVARELPMSAPEVMLGHILFEHS
jgi:hypothetical protein